MRLLIYFFFLSVHEVTVCKSMKADLRSYKNPEIIQPC